MNVPDREAAHTITWMTEMQLSHGGHALPAGLSAALREYKSALLAACTSEKWARPGHPTRYGRLADLIGQQIADGERKPGERMPSSGHLATRHGEKKDTVTRALHILAVRGQLALETGSYYVLPRRIAQHGSRADRWQAILRSKVHYARPLSPRHPRILPVMVHNSRASCAGPGSAGTSSLAPGLRGKLIEHYSDPA
jgi:DNA-binding transcriptional regulator YhcF (GntR family)